jgi:spermidine/putrescine transport system ATP-binding protein
VADPAGTTAPVVAVEHVTKRFGDVVAVDDVSFAVARGEFFSLLGPSGCGKTTLLRLVAGFEEPSAGTIRLDGRDLRGVPPYRRAVNTVFQHYALFPHLTVFENVAFGPRIRRLPAGEVERRVRAMLDVVRLGDLAARRPSQLSGGQRQRVALARALVNGPSALLLDEPLSALDLALRREMQGELKRIQREVGISFVFVTHDQGEAIGLSDRIAVLRAGRVEQLGTPQAIYDAPATSFVARFIGMANLLPVQVERASATASVVRLPGGGAVTVDGTAPLPGAALLMVRPERVDVVAAAPPSERLAVAATLTELVFHGAVVRCVARTAGGVDVVAHLDPRRRDPTLATGAACWLTWDASAARVLPPDAAR